MTGATFRTLGASSLVLVLMGCTGLAPTAPSVSAPAATVAPASDAPSAAATPTSIATVPPVAEASPTPEPVATWDPAWDRCVRHPYDGSIPGRAIIPRAAIKVAVAELNLRFGPCKAAKKLGTLTRGTVLVVSDSPYGPVKAGGYAWYQVVFPPGILPSGELQPLPGSWFPDGTDTDGGWIAATDAATAFVSVEKPRCPTTADLVNVVAMLPSEWLACFHAPIELTGTYGCGGCGGAGGPIASPSWLADGFEFGTFRVRWGDGWEFQPVTLHFKPDGPARPPEGAIIHATVHVDDPAAASCRFEWRLDDPSFVVPDATAIAWCRERLVVDSYDVVGADPGFPH